MKILVAFAGTIENSGGMQNVCIQFINEMIRRRICMSKITGTVKFFKDTNGYGFITPDKKSDKDIFVHATGLAGELKTLHVGDKVSYEVKEGKRGPQATNVEVISE